MGNKNSQAAKTNRSKGNPNISAPGQLVDPIDEYAYETKRPASPGDRLKVPRNSILNEYPNMKVYREPAEGWTTRKVHRANNVDQVGNHEIMSYQISEGRSLLHDPNQPIIVKKKRRRTVKMQPSLPPVISEPYLTAPSQMNDRNFYMQQQSVQSTGPYHTVLPPLGPQASPYGQQPYPLFHRPSTLYNPQAQTFQSLS